MSINALILKWAIQTIILEYKYPQNAIKILFKMRSKCCLVKQNFGCMHFKIVKTDVAKQNVFK